MQSMKKHKLSAKAVVSVVGDLKKMASATADLRSFLRFAADLLLCRASAHSKYLHRALDRKSGQSRQIRLRGGVQLVYRINKGDLQSIREVWLDEAYRLPSTLGASTKADVLVDLGANIGLTSVWLCKRYGFTTVLAVEPSSGNARLACLNLRRNGIQAQVIEAAVGPKDCTAFYQEEEASSMGHVALQGKPISMLSMKSVLDHLAAGTPVDLVKMDIEGGEEALLRGDLTWLDSVQGIIAELHPEIIDYPAAIQSLQDAGFRYIAAGSAHKDSMDSFVKRA